MSTQHNPGSAAAVAESRAAIDSLLHRIDAHMAEIGARLGAITEALDDLRAERARLARLRRQHQPLTPHQLAVASRYAWSGLTKPELARELHISANTLKSHLRHAYKALGVADREALRRELLILGNGRWTDSSDSTRKGANNNGKAYRA